MSISQKLYAWFLWSLTIASFSYALSGCQSLTPEMRDCLDKCGRDCINKQYPNP